MFSICCLGSIKEDIVFFFHPGDLGFQFPEARRRCLAPLKLYGYNQGPIFFIDPLNAHKIYSSCFLENPAAFFDKNHKDRMTCPDIQFAVLIMGLLDHQFRVFQHLDPGACFTKFDHVFVGFGAG